MGSCTSKGVSNSKQNSRKPSKIDFNVQDLTPFHPDYQGSLPQDKINQQSNNTTIQRIVPPSINDENQSTRLNKNKKGINSVSKLKIEIKEVQQGTQHTHTDCDIQFTSFEMKPQNLPNGSFVGVNNLSDSAYKNVLRESQNLQSNQNIPPVMNNQSIQLNLQNSSSAQNKYAWGTASYQKKIIKDNYLLSKSDKKKENMALYLNSLSKKGSHYGNNVQEFQLEKMEQDIEEKQIAFSGIGIIKTFHNMSGNLSKNLSNNNNNNINNQDPKSLAQYHQKRMESMFDNMINRTSEKSIDFFDEHAYNFLYLNTQEYKDPIMSQRQLSIPQQNSFIQGKGQSQEFHPHLFQGPSGIQANNLNGKQKSAKPLLTLSGAEDPSFGKIPSMTAQYNKIHINILNLNEKDKALLLKYAKNWIYLSRAFQQKGEYSDSLSCLLPATSLFSQIGLSDYLVVVLAEAYSSYLTILFTKKDEYNEAIMKKIEQKFLYIRQIVLSGSPNQVSQILEKQYTGSFINKSPNPLLQQEPSQKNTEKTFIFDDWKNANNPHMQNSSHKERCQNELIFFLELLYNLIKSPQKQFNTVLSSLIDLVESNQSNSILFNHSRLSSIYKDFKLLYSMIIQGDAQVPQFENKGIKSILEFIEQNKGESSGNVGQNSIIRFLQTLVNDHSKILLSQFVEETNKVSDIKINLKTKPISDVLIKLGHLLRVWLDLSQHALFFYEQAFNHDKTSCEALFFTAITLRNLDKTQEAIQYYNQALEINNYYTECYINLGNIYLQEFQNLAISEKFYIKALISSYCSTMQSALVCKGRIFNLLGEIQKQNSDFILASVFYSCGILKDSLYEENYYDLIDALNCLEFDVTDSKQYFKIIIEVVSFSVFEKADWTNKLNQYKNELKIIYKKSQNCNTSCNFSLLESIILSEDSYSQFISTFQTQSIEQNEVFVATLLKKTISQNIKEIQDLYTRKSIQEESSKEDVQYISALRDFISEITN